MRDPAEEDVSGDTRSSMDKLVGLSERARVVGLVWCCLLRYGKEGSPVVGVFRGILVLRSDIVFCDLLCFVVQAFDSQSD